MSRKLTEEEFKEKAREVHGDWYDYSHVEYGNNKTKVTIVCPEHGPFPQKPSKHLHGQGCSVCRGKKLTKDEFEKRAKQIHGDKYNYDYVAYKDNRTKVTIVCSEHGPFPQKPDNHLNGEGCPDCGGNKKLTKDEFEKRAKQVHGDKYDYKKVDYVNKKTDVTIICPIHGEFEQTPDEHLRGLNCPYCLGRKRFNIDEFKEKARQVHGDKYDYNQVDYVNRATKVSIVCPEHGPFSQTPSKHLSGQGCPDCKGGKPLTTKKFKEKARNIHGDYYDYRKVKYINNQTDVTIVCPIHGDFEQTPGNHLHGYGCSRCAKTKRLTEELFAEKARSIHGDWYNYDYVNYVNHQTHVKILCPVHGEFEQKPNKHLNGNGCPKCAVGLKEYYANKWLKENVERYYRPCNIYLIKMYNDTESFLKLGITTKDVNERYNTEKSKGGYSYEVIVEKETNRKNAILVELKAKEHISRRAYQPQVQFDGWTECYTLDAYNDLLEVIDNGIHGMYDHECGEDSTTTEPAMEV